MNREEIRKKWKNKELAEVTNSKQLSRNNQVSSNKSSWERVQSTANAILNQQNNRKTSKLDNFKSNVSAIVGNFGLGVKDSAIDTTYFMDRQTYRNSPEYRALNKRQQAEQEKEELQQKIKSGVEGKQSFLPTAENLRKKETNKIGLLPERDTRETTVFQRGANKILEQDEQKITQNIDSTTNRVTRKIAELTPSIAQSTTGMAISALNPVLRK